MALIKFKAYLIPRNTSMVLCAPGYEKPFIQRRFNTNGDRTTWVKEIEWPKDLPVAGQVQDVNMEAEMQRLASQYTVDMFRLFYPTDEMFEAAFKSCQTEALPGPSAVPEMSVTPELLIDEIMELRVPSMTRDMAAKLVEANQTADTLAHADARALNTATSLPLNLIRSTIEAAKARPAFVPSGAPSAPSQFKPTKVEAPGLT